MNNAKNFLVSTADFALYYKDILACTGNTNLNTSIEVSMQEQNVNAGKGNKLVYSYKYGREINVTLEAADWKLEYIAASVGSKITEGLTDVYKMGECIQITDGIGVLPSIPIGEVAVELPNGTIVTVTPELTSIDLTKFSVNHGTVKVTYQYRATAKSITIDSDTSPNVYKLVLKADKHNNQIGKVGSVEVIIPSYQPSGNFTMNFTPDGVSSTSIDGKALAVEKDTCDNGSSVYAYIKEYDDISSAITVSEIAATPAILELPSGMAATISVIGLKGTLYSPIQLDNADCTFVSDDPTVAIVDDKGMVKAVSSGPASIYVNYDDHEDVIDVVVDGNTIPKLISENILTIHTLSEKVLGKSVSDLISNDVKVLAGGAVTGTLKYVTQFTDFDNSDTNNQSGHYFPFKLSQEGEKMTIKTNGVANVNKTDMPFDSEILLRVPDNKTTFTIEVDEKEVITLNFRKAILA